MAQKFKTFKPTWTHLIKAPFDWAISPPVSYFPSRKQNFHPEVFLSVGLSLEIMATFLYLTRVLFFAVHTRKRHRFTLECHNPMLFLLPDAPHRIIPIPSPPYRLLIIFFTKGYQAYMHFLYLFLSFNKPTIKFYTQLYIDSLHQGYFLRPTCQTNSSAARKLQVPSTVVSFSCTSQNNCKCTELHFVLLLML